MSAADPTAALAAYLLAQPAVSAIVAGRVFRPDLPASEDKLMPRACIVVREAGGGNLFGPSNIGWGDPRIDLICYGARRLEADQLAREVALALKALRRQTLEGCALQWARPSKPLPLIDQDTQWPYSLVSAQVAHTEPAVA